MRIDKLLAGQGLGTRSEIKKNIREGLATVNGLVIRQADFKVEPGRDKITYKGQTVAYEKYEYYLLNKPAGYVSATEDSVYPTVIELITDTLRTDLFPVGRLDVGTEGLLLITNDGQLSHRLLSPKRHVDKLYFAKIEGIVTEQDIAAFAQGLNIGEEKPTLPAKLQILSVDEKKGSSEIRVTLQEGKYHQVKRMFQAVGKEVTYLQRIAMACLTLDSSLPLGSFRRLTEEEIAALKQV